VHQSKKTSDKRATLNAHVHGTNGARADADC